MKASRWYVSHTDCAVESEKRLGSRYNSSRQRIKGGSAVVRLSDRGESDMRGTCAGCEGWGGMNIIAILDLILWRARGDWGDAGAMQVEVEGRI